MYRYMLSTVYDTTNIPPSIISKFYTTTIRQNELFWLTVFIINYLSASPKCIYCLYQISFFVINIF